MYVWRVVAYCSPFLMQKNGGIKMKISLELLEKEIKQLKKQNKNLLIRCEQAEKYQNEYKNLCAEMKEHKKKYKKETEKLKNIEVQYEEALREIKKRAEME